MPPAGHNRIYTTLTDTTVFTGYILDPTISPSKKAVGLVCAAAYQKMRVAISIRIKLNKVQNRVNPSIIGQSMDKVTRNRLEPWNDGAVGSDKCSGSHPSNRPDR